MVLPMWIQLDTGTVNGLTLDLYQSGPDYMIRVDGLELMNSRWPKSEKFLAKVARESVSRSAPRILIGGLGLGFTLGAVLAEFGQEAEIRVAEKSPEVLGWYRTHFKQALHGDPDDSQVQFVTQDVKDAVAEAGRIDLILLDVDNGPEPVSGDSNGALYTREGLSEMMAHLQPRGALLLWSAFESQAFFNTAAEAGLSVDAIPVRVGLREHNHFIYRLKRFGP